MSLNGIDVSAFQPSNITSLVNYDFVLIKATEGTSYVSPNCAAQYAAAKARGKLLGVYHFADGLSATAEADHFVSNVRGYIGEALLVLDMEANALRQGPNWAKSFLDRVKATTGVTPLIYGSKGNICLSSYKVVANAGYPLWVAAYPSPARTTYSNVPTGSVSPWKGATIYQYTSSGRLPGYNANLDLDMAYITAAQWKAMASVGGKATNTQEEDMPLTQADANLIANTLAGNTTFLNAVAVTTLTRNINSTLGGEGNALQLLHNQLTDIQTKVNALQTALATPGGADAATLEAAAQAGAEKALSSAEITVKSTAS